MGEAQTRLWSFKPNALYLAAIRLQVRALPRSFLLMLCHDQITNMFRFDSNGLSFSEF
jgi:hypothetical protein